MVKLYISDNYLGTVGITKITKTLAKARGLKVLDLTSNDITSEAAESIAKVIMANPSLESLLLGEGCSQLKNAIKHQLISNSKLYDQMSLLKLNEMFLCKQMLRIKEDTKILWTTLSF